MHRLIRIANFAVVALLIVAPGAAQAPAPAPQNPAPAAPQPSAPPGPAAPIGALNLQNASLSQVVDQLARYLHMNIMVDSKLEGSVTFNTYGQTNNLDARDLLNQILRINGFGLTQAGDIYRVVPLSDIGHQPLRPLQLSAAEIPNDDQTILNLVFLKYVAVDELMKVLDAFSGEHAQLRSYAPANLLFILDSRRNMRRTMEIINLFDSDTFVNQRIKLFELKNTRPSDIQKDLENILKTVALDSKSAPAKFLPIDRINTLIAIASDPGYGGYGVMGVPGSNPGGYGSMNSFAPGFGGAGSCGGMTGAPYGAGYGGAYGAPAFGGYAAQVPYGMNPNGGTGQTVGTAPAGATAGAAAAPQSAGAEAEKEKPPRIVPNPLDNALIIQCDAQQYQNILSILKELDTPPRQILLEAKIMQVDLTDQFASGVTYALAPKGNDRALGLGLNGAGAGLLTGGALVSNAKELLAALSLNENASHVHTLSEPSLIATDSIPATINVGTQVPVSTGSTAIPTSGGVATTSSLSSEDTGVTLQVNARVSPSGIVTLYIGQQISAVNNSVALNGSPGFDQQVVQTQITVQDGDTIAVGGTIKDVVSDQVNGIPGLVRIPWLGALFGSKVRQHTRTELIMFMTPHVIWDETSLIEASDELKTRVHLLKKMVKNL